MKIIDLFKEHRIVFDQNMGSPELTGGQDIGKIKLKTSNIDANIYKIDDNLDGKNFIILIAHYNDIIYGFLVLMKLPYRTKLYMATKAMSYFKGNNILLNLILFSKNNLGLRIISDVSLTTQGQAAWKSFAKMPGVNLKIYNYDNDKSYSLNDPNAKLPELDYHDNDEDMNWFYIIENTQ